MEVKTAILGQHTSQDPVIGPVQDARQTILPPGQPVTDVTRPIRAEAQARAKIRVCQGLVEPREEGVVEAREEGEVEALEEEAVEVLKEVAGVVMEALDKEVVVIVTIQGQWMTSKN